MEIEFDVEYETPLDDMANAIVDIVKRHMDNAMSKDLATEIATYLDEVLPKKGKAEYTDDHELTVDDMPEPDESRD